MKKIKSLILIALVALPVAVNAQVSTVNPSDPAHVGFFNTFTGYFSSFNTNFDGILDAHKGTLWLGQDMQGGAHTSTSLGLEYTAYKSFGICSKTRLEDVTGEVKSQSLGAAYNIIVHDVRISGAILGSYDFKESRAQAQFEIAALKILTEHTFANVRFLVPVEKQSRPILTLGGGFIF